MPHVGLVLRREAADEEGHALSMERDELLLLPGEAVVHPEGHFFVRMRAARIKALQPRPPMFPIVTPIRQAERWLSDNVLSPQATSALGPPWCPVGSRTRATAMPSGRANCIA